MCYLRIYFLCFREAPPAVHQKQRSNLCLLLRIPLLDLRLYIAPPTEVSHNPQRLRPFNILTVNLRKILIFRLLPRTQSPLLTVRIVLMVPLIMQDIHHPIPMPLVYPSILQVGIQVHIQLLVRTHILRILQILRHHLRPVIARILHRGKILLSITNSNRSGLVHHHSAIHRQHTPQCSHLVGISQRHLNILPPHKRPMELPDILSLRLDLRARQDTN